jgi:hypothetical protein
MQPTDTPTRYDVLSEPHPDNPDIGLYRAVAFHPDGSIDVLYEGKGREGREWAYTLAGRLEREDREKRLAADA